MDIIVILATSLLYLCSLWFFVLKQSVAVGIEQAKIWKKDSKTIYYLNVCIEIIIAGFRLFFVVNVCFAIICGIAYGVWYFWDSISNFLIILLLLGIFLLLLARK